MVDTPTPPVKIALVGTGDGASVAVTTPDHLPNLVVKVVSPLVALVVAFAYAFGIALSGLIGAAGFSQSATMVLSGGHGDFFTAVHNSLWLALAAACADLLKNCIVLLGRLKERFPVASGSAL